ncbi:MAG: hypothetical protein HQM02_03815 [Magnetococcales bacterium]|nr:hypothetical protein [Magnetococcales bacterium]
MSVILAPRTPWDQFSGCDHQFARTDHQTSSRLSCRITLTGKPFYAKLSIFCIQLSELRNQHGEELERWWHDRFGYTFDRLTQSEARYLARTTNAERIRDQIAQKQQKGDR